MKWLFNLLIKYYGQPDIRLFLEENKTLNRELEHERKQSSEYWHSMNRERALCSSYFKEILELKRFIREHLKMESQEKDGR